MCVVCVCGLLMFSYSCAHVVTCVRSCVRIDVCVLCASIVHVLLWLCLQCVCVCECVFICSGIYVCGVGGGDDTPIVHWTTGKNYPFPPPPHRGKSGRRPESVWPTPSQTVQFKSLWSSPKHAHTHPTHTCMHTHTRSSF